MISAKGIEGLKDWYESHLTEHKEHSKEQTRNMLGEVRFYFWLYAGIFCIVLIFLITSDSDIAMFTPVLYGLFNFLVLSFYIYALSIGKTNTLEELKREGIVKPFANLTRTGIDEILNELATSMS